MSAVPHIITTENLTNLLNTLCGVAIIIKIKKKLYAFYVYSFSDYRYMRTTDKRDLNEDMSHLKRKQRKGNE